VIAYYCTVLMDTFPIYDGKLLPFTVVMLFTDIQELENPISNLSSAQKNFP